MINAIFETISSAITGLAGAIGDAVTGIVGMFWDSTGSTFTFLGTLTLVGLGAGLVFFAIRLIYRAVKGVA